MAEVKIKSVWDGDTTSYLVYVNGERKGAHWTYEDAKAEADKYEQETKSTNKEERIMKDNAQAEVMQIEVNGVKFSQTRPGYYYRRDEENKKWTRISKAEWEKAFEEFTWDAEDEKDEREAKQNAEDKKTEDNFNKKQAKKAQPRKSKDIAFESGEITLTSKQVDFIKRLSESNFYNNVDSILWCDCLADDLGGQFAGKPMTIGAMISTLKEKKLIEVGRDTSREGKPKFMAFTDLGKQVAKELGLN